MTRILCLYIIINALNSIRRVGFAHHVGQSPTYILVPARPAYDKCSCEGDATVIQPSHFSPKLNNQLFWKDDHDQQ